MHTILRDKEPWKDSIKHLMLHAYCLVQVSDWDEGIPLLSFAIRETIQESVGFSAVELVFGHSVKGPPKLLHEPQTSVPTVNMNVLDYVSSFWDRLHSACGMAKQIMAESLK